MSISRRAATAITVATALMSAAASASAQSVEDFFKGKTISILVGAGEGGSFVPYAQLLADHIKRHVPGAPNVIVKTMGGQGGGLDTAIQMSNTIPRDGLTIGMTQSTVVLAQVLNPEYAKYDSRQWAWLGNMAEVRNMLAIWHTAKAQSVADAKTHEVIVGATGPTSPTYIIPDFLNKYAGTKFKIVTGYKGTADLNLAILRGEIEARGGSWLSVELAAPEMIAEKKIKPIVFASLTKEPGYKSAPTLAELVDDPRHKKAAEFISSEASFARSFFLPPAVPADRVATLRKAFEDALADKALLADAAKRKMPIELTKGTELQRIAAEVVATPADVLKFAK